MKLKSVLFCFLMVYSLVANTQNIHPYLQAPSSNSIYITWKTSFTNSPVLVYGLSPTNLSTTVNGSVSQFFDGGYAGNYFYNTVQPTGLVPNTKYYYKVISGTLESDTLSFKTLPLAGQSASVDGHIRFLIMGDNQINTTGRYDTLVAQAKRKVVEKWGGDVSDHIALTFMVGDQVDLGNLSQYEDIHFGLNKELSGNIPIQTTVGNHETYGALGMSAYYSHFYLSQMTYQGISSGNENYYAMQAGNVLFISFSSEHTGAAQYTWLQQVMAAAQSDATVDWVLSFSHRPYESEQYVGDISTWIKNTAVPFCMQYNKYFMHVGAHHHIYSRGQFKNEPVYNIISGGTAWDQYWGQSTEQDFDYIQKTISNWCYQIMDVDVVNQKVDIETYSIGSPIMFANNEWKNNELVDEFHRYKNLAVPNTPIITSLFGDSLQLPFTITTTPYSSSTSEILNSTEFQIAQTIEFTVTEMDLLRDFENLYGQAPGQTADSTEDINTGVNIEEYSIPIGNLPNGKHFVRVRHRDRNLEWSGWSQIDSFIVYNSFSTGPYIIMDSSSYHFGSSLIATYTNGPGNSDDWIGLYHLGDIPGGVGSTSWQYCNGVSGTMNFSGSALTQSDMYYAAFFELDGYNEIAQRDTFYYGNVPIINSDTNSFAVGMNVPLYISNAPVIADSVEVLKVGFTHGVQPSAYWGAVNTSTDTLTVLGLPKGYYTAKYYFRGEYLIGEPFFFSVGDTITNLWIDQPVYVLGEDINASWTDAPGIVKDWLGIYNDGDDPNVDPLVIYTYFDGVAFGTKTLTDTLLPVTTGDYFIVMFTNDSYTEVSNREYFSIVPQTIGTTENEMNPGVSFYPNPSAGNDVTLLSSDYPIEYIQLIDMNGKVLYRAENINNQKYLLLEQQLPNGVYILEVQTRKLFRYKIVID